MARIFLRSGDFSSGIITISGEKSRYLTSVLRLGPGDGLFIHDERGCVYRAKISAATRKETTVEVGEKVDTHTESPLHITLFQGLLKGEKMDLVIQKVTELGVREIYPMVTERSQVRETRKVRRWSRIAEEASRQSGRNTVPLIHDPIIMEDLPAGGPRSGIIFWEETAEGLSEALSDMKGAGNISLVTGPEGGFSEREVSGVSEKGFLVATLGSRILRAETAAITAVAITQFSLGDIGPASAAPRRDLE